MDYSKIQRSIIAGCLGEGRFEAVKWLEVKDFDLEYQPIWRRLKSGEDASKLAYSSNKCYNLALLTDYTHIDRLGLLLLESRFRQYAEELLQSAILNTDDISISMICQKALDESKKEDVFDLIDHLPDYLRPFMNVKRFEDLKKYVDGRAKDIKVTS